MPAFKRFMRYLLAAFYVLAGVNHFVMTEFYVKIMPPYLPWHVPLVYASGCCEAALGILVLVPGYTRVAAWGLILLLLAVFPANVHMAAHAELFPNLSPLLLWLRLPLQGVLIAWAYWYAKADGVPARRTE